MLGATILLCKIVTYIEKVFIMQIFMKKDKSEYSFIEKVARSPEGFFAAFLVII